MTAEEMRAAWFLLSEHITPEQIRATGKASPDVAGWCERTASNMDEITVTFP